MLKRLREFLGVRLAANFTTTVVTATATGLTFNINANEVWAVDVQLTAQCSAAGGVKYEIAAPTGATIEGWLLSSTTTITTLSYQRITAINTLTATATHTVATTPGPDIIRFTVTNGSTAGAITIEAASGTATQTTTIFAMSSLTAMRVA
jgi:hypothetical protein